MDDEHVGSSGPPDIPFLQRLYDRPFVLLALGMGIMLVVFTAWGLWEVASLPEATLP
jgi:hypothetical protein